MAAGHTHTLRSPNGFHLLSSTQAELSGGTLSSLIKRSHKDLLFSCSGGVRRGQGPARDADDTQKDGIVRMCVCVRETECVISL